jgi:hypothetical protein
MREWSIFSKNPSEKRQRRRFAAAGVAAIASVIPGGIPHEQPSFDSNFVCDVARHREYDPELKDENRLHDIIIKSYQLNRNEGYQLYYYFDLATSNIGKPIPTDLASDIVDVDVQNDVVGLKFNTPHNQLYRDATRPSPDSITIITENAAQPEENLPVVLYTRKMIVQEENRDRYYPVDRRSQKIIDPDHSMDLELTLNHGVEVVKFCKIPGKGEISVNAGYLDLRVFPIIYTE